MGGGGVWRVNTLNKSEMILESEYLEESNKHKKKKKLFVSNYLSKRSFFLCFIKNASEGNQNCFYNQVSNCMSVSTATKQA